MFKVNFGEVTMALLYFIVLAFLGQAQGLVELNCSDNATCIDLMARDFVRSIREQKAVRLFDLFTIEPIENRKARSYQDQLTRLITSHAISFDWDDFTFRFSNPENRNDGMNLEVFENRVMKDDTDKKAKSKADADIPDDKSRRRPIRRRHRRKLMQAIIPMFIGMKSAAVAIFILVMVTVITLKAFLASKVALLVTIIMAVKKFYESYGNGLPETSNVLWNLARNIRALFGLPQSPLSSPSISMPMYSYPQMSQMTSNMFSPTMSMPTVQ